MNLKKVLLPGLLGVIVASAAGWYGFQYFDGAGQKPAAPVAAKPAAKQKQKVAGPAAAPQPGKSSESKPAQVAGASAGETKSEAPRPVGAEAERAKLIDDILTVSGFRQQMKQLPEIILAGARQSRMQQGANVAVTMPLVEKMIYELQQPSPAEAQAFISGLVAKPMSAGRSALIKRIDATAKSSQIGAEIALTSIKSMAFAVAGKDKAARKNIEISIGKNKQKIADQVSGIGAGFGPAARQSSNPEVWRSLLLQSRLHSHGSHRPAETPRGQDAGVQA